MPRVPKPVVAALILALPSEFLNITFAAVHFKGVPTDAPWIERWLYKVGLFSSFPVTLLIRWHVLPGNYSGVGMFVTELSLGVLSGYLAFAILITGVIYLGLSIGRLFQNPRL